MPLPKTFDDPAENAPPHIRSMKDAKGDHRDPYLGFAPSEAQYKAAMAAQYGQIEMIDDAVGEAFDKVAKALGLGYPGGPALAALAERGDPTRFALPRPLLHAPTLDFSFSGLKTAVALKVGSPDWRAEYAADLAAAFQEAVVEVLVTKTVAAVRAAGLRRVVVAGGVGANRRLREMLAEAGAKQGFAVFYPDVALCTDNGAMIAFAAALRLEAGAEVKWDRRIEVRPRWALEGLRQG